MRFINHLCSVTRFMQLPREHRRLTFYSEGKNYWPHLKGLINEVLAISEIPVCYISSGEDDPGLLFKHPNYKTFIIDEGFVRNWMFENLDTDVMVMTMPDLHQYQVKRSKFKVHYVYVQHSLVSLHMVYRKGAFDYYDTIFCAGPHHVKEIRAIETKYNLPSKNLVEHGYGLLEDIKSEAERRPKNISVDVTKHALIAPSWGPKGTIESGLGLEIVDKLIDQGHKVTLRPHPQTTKFAGDKVNAILNKYVNNPLFNYEANVVGQNSLHESDFMVSDWSGVAMDYAFGLNKPVLFIDVPRKVNNLDYKEIEIEPFEVSVREKIGIIMTDKDFDFEKLSNVKVNYNSDDFYYKDSNRRGAKALLSLVSVKEEAL